MKSFLILVFLLAISSIVIAKDRVITDFGAIGDGKVLNTIAIQKAIDKAHKKGDRVVIPKGVFLTGTINLKSNVELHLEEGATLLGSKFPEDYPYYKLRRTLIRAINIENIKITGKGVIEGRGDQIALYLDSLFYAGEIDSKRYNVELKRPKWWDRPQLIEMIHCQKIEIRNIQLKHAASWVQKYDDCQDIIIDSIQVDSDTYWNNDGIDIIDCINVKLTNSYFNASDDGICLKSRSYNQRDGLKLCDSIYINNCTVRSSASAVKLGTNSFGGFRNVVIKNIKVFDTFRSAIAIESVDGGILENVYIDSIDAQNTGNAIFVKLGNRTRYRKDSMPGTLKNIIIKNLKCAVPFEAPDKDYEIRGPALAYFHNVFPSSITGIPNYPVQNITLENIKIVYPGRGNAAYANMPIDRKDEIPENEANYPEFSMFGELPAWGFYIRHVEGLVMRNVKLTIKNKDYRPAIVMDDVEGDVIESLEVIGDEKDLKIVR